MRFLILLVPVLALAQFDQRPPYNGPQFATQLNGTSQYWSKSSPTGLDLNGAEKLPNPGFEANTTGWAGETGLSLARNTNLDRVRTGVGSAACRSDGTAAGILRLASGQVSDATTNKFTSEAWVFLPTTNASDSVRLYLADQTGATFSIGTTVEPTKGAWTKLVLNSQAAGTQTGLRLAIQFRNPTAGDSLYVDDVSLTQAYDAVVMAVVNQAVTSASSKVIFTYRGTSTGPRYTLYSTATTDLFAFQLDDSIATVSQVTGGTSLVTGSYRLIGCTIDRTGNAVKYLDGSAIQTSSVVAIGKIASTAATQATLGDNSGGTAFFPGSIGPVMVVRFDALPSDIANMIAYVSATWRRKGFPKTIGNGTTVLYVDWNPAGLDESGQANTLTPVAGAGTVKIR
jgi:hypothetical protein